MHRSPLARLGLAVLTAVLCTAGLAAPAQAAPDTGTLTGHLSNHAGRPVAGAFVEIYDASTSEELSSTDTDLDGAFTVTDLTASEVKVLFTVRGLEWWAGGAADVAHAKAFPITAGETITVDETLPAPALRGRLTQHTGGPAANAQVNVYDKDDYDLLDWVTTDRDGNFEVHGLPAGKIKIEFRFHSYTQWAGSGDEYDTAKVFTIRRGATTTVDSTLGPLGIFTGRLVDHAGAPAPGARVIPTDQNRNRLYADVYTDDDGRWTWAVTPAPTRSTSSCPVAASGSRAPGTRRRPGGSPSPTVSR